MKRLLLFLAALVSTLPARAVPPVATESNPMTFTADGSFKFNIPVGFMTSQQSGNTYPVFVNAPTAYTAYMQVATDNYRGNLQQFVEAELNGFRASPAMANLALSASGTITTKTGVKGIRVLMTFASAKGPMEMAAYYFPKPNEVEVLHGFCFVQLASQFVPLFDNSANTIVLLK
jgi:hypothetical protein